MPEGLGQWLREFHGINICFPTPMPSQRNSSVELGIKNITHVPSEKVSTNSQAVSNDAGPNEAIDFTSKPVQKSKRKKHRPKVIREGKSAKTQKSTTQEPPQEDGNQSTGKRKYVRRKGLSTPVTQPPSEYSDIQDKSEPVPARRSLNFNEEDLQDNAYQVSQAQVTEDGNQSTGKRKYVRRKGLSTPVTQPPSEYSDIQDKSEPVPARRSLNFNEEDLQDNAYQVSQAQVTEIPIGTGDPQSSLSAVEITQVQVECHWGGTSSSIPASVNPMANVQELWADRVSDGVSLDLNYSIDQTPSKCANPSDSSVQFSQSGPRETVQINQLLDFPAGMPDRSVSRVNTSGNQMQNSSTDFGQYVGASQFYTQIAPRTDQILHGYMMPENPVVHPQHTKRVLLRENSNPEACRREDIITNQMLQKYRVPQSPIALPMHYEKDGMNGSLNKFSVNNDSLRFATSRNNHIGTSFGLHAPCDFSDVLTAGKKGEHNATNGPQISIDMNFDNLNSPRPFCSDPHSTSSQTSYLTDTCKKMRPESQSYWLNKGVSKFSSSSAYLPSNWNTNEDSVIKSGICTLANLQRLMALEKSRSYQCMVDFGVSEINVVERPNMVQQQSKHTKHNTSGIDFLASPDKQFRYLTSLHTQLPESTLNSLGENSMPSNVLRIGSHQLQSLGIRPTLRSSTDNDSVALPDKQSRYLNAEHALFPRGTAYPLIESYTPSDGIHQLQYLENRIAKGSDFVPETCNAFIHDDTVNNYSITIPDEQIRSTGAEDVGQTVSGSTRTDQCFLDASREIKAANPTKKPKVRGHPKKQPETNVKAKGRGTRKENVGRTKCISSKETHTDLLNNGGISYGSEPSAGITPRAITLESETNGERTSNNLEISDHEEYSSRGSKYIHAGNISEVIALPTDPVDALIQQFKLLTISKSDKVVAAVPKNTLFSNKGECGALVPFEGNVKKKRPRAKVSIDPVTNLMWNLLMAPDMCDGTEGMDNDKERLLDEERRVFRGRIDSFIARMHLVQGDRRFSPWKGSVVDSVVGVFLTQNVSDHLSSSAFMAVAAKFPAKSEGFEKTAATPEQKDSCPGLPSDSMKLQGNISVEEIITTEFNEGNNSNKLVRSFAGDGVNCAAGEYSVSYRKSLPGLQEQEPQGSVVPASSLACVVEAEDGSFEDAISSLYPAGSAQNSPNYLFHRTDHVGSSSLPYFTEESNMPNGMASPTVCAELPPMQDLKNMHNAKVGSSEYDGVNLLPVPGVNKGVLLDLNKTYQPVNTSASYVQNGQFYFTDGPYVSHWDKSFCTGLDRSHPNVTQPEDNFYQFSSSSTMPNPNETQKADYSSKLLCCMDVSSVQETSRFPSGPSQKADLSPIHKQNYQPLISLEEVPFSFCERIFSTNETEAPFLEQHNYANSQEVYTAGTNQMGGLSGCSQYENNIKLQEKTCEKPCSSNLCGSQNAHSEVSQGVTSGPIGKSKDTRMAPLDFPIDDQKGKKVRGRAKRKTYDWDNLRKEVFSNGGNKQRSQNAKDSIDWEAVRQADVRDISETIRERGMNNMLAERIKEFLNRLVWDHGSIDLEWLRDLEPDKAKEYLLSIRGLGLKSVECVRLLTLHHMAFPVDTNVARICVRLGWVPLQPLPDSLQLHLLELYPMLEHIQKYLWPRLCKLDQLTLYELHYQMITFGKVFCSKSKPNCNSCPMRAECKHFASAFASARLALPGPEEKSLVASKASNAAESCHQTYIDSRPVGQLEWSANNRRNVVPGNEQPIIEEPSSPEPENEIAETKEGSIEDLFSEDPDEIPTINLNIEEFTQNLKSYMQANNIEIEDADMSKALVAITPEAASLPTPKLKNVSRLRTEHQVYELPDSHPLLEGFDQRLPDDPCPYLLSIWTPGETAQSTDAPKSFCNSEETGKLCESSACFSCNSIREMQAQKVRATILIPCRTAMRGSFPLNGTYFQVNELFADHYSSRNPIDVPRSWIWNLPRRTVYFGTSIPTIFRGLTTEEIQQCFWRGFVCVRGFDRTLRAPRPLYARLHVPASKVTRIKRHAAGREGE